MSAVNVPFDPEGASLDLPSPGRGPVHITREGPRGGRQVLCVHGVPGSLRDFRYLAPRLAAEGFEVYRVDLPGFGDSPRSTWSDDTVQGRASLIALIARTLRLKRPILAAHSIGASPCLLAASWHPGRVAGLLLVNPAGLERHRSLQIPQLASPVARRLLALPGIGDRVLKLAQEGYRKAGFRDSPSRDELLQMFAVVDGMDFRALRAAARDLRCPTLLASAQDDPLVQPRVSHSLADAVPTRCEHVHYETGGHHLQKHQARDLAERAAVFFR